MALTRYAQKQQRFLTLPLLIILAVISAQISSSFGDKKVDYDKPGDCAASDVRVITSEELKAKKGENEGEELWLSVLGEVFDVSTGRQHYVGSSYSVFTGSDSSASFTTGDFSESGGKQSLDEIKDSQLGGIESWRKFYHEHETYEFIGVLEGLYYDKDGQPTEDLKKLRERIETAKKKRGETQREKKKKKEKK